MRLRALSAATGLAAALAAAGAPASSAAAVDVLVVGKDRVLRGPTEVVLKARRAQAGGRRCAAGAATPLSALLGAGLPLRIRDYGSCSRSPGDAGGLFVTQVGSERNRGRDGWVYKVGRRAGTAPAADPSGPFGTGRRLRDGQDVLWFWCVLSRRGSCQRTLEATPDRSTAAVGAVVRVTVRGYDDSGRGVPAAGATVRLGTAQATTEADGVAALTVAPGATGRLALSAEQPGAVRAFSSEVTVR